MLRRVAQAVLRPTVGLARSIPTASLHHQAVRVSDDSAEVVPPPLTTLTDEEQMLQDAAARFAKEAVAPLVDEMEEKEALDPSIWQGMFEQGYMGVEIPMEYGGTGASFMSTVLVVEELAKVDAGTSVSCDVQNTLVNNMFKNWASDELKSEYFPRLATDTVAAFALSEAGAGSDAFALQTTAKKDGDDYVLTGEKMWITNAAEAGVFLVMANVDHSLGYKGITCFVVDEGTEGLSVGSKIKKMGIRSSSTCPVVLDDVRVNKRQILGEIGHGYKYAIELLNEGRIGIGAQMIGIAQGVFDQTIPYLFDRKAFGQPIGTFQGMQNEYAKIATDIEAAKLLVYNAARLKQANQPFVKEAAMAKWYASIVAEQAATKCIEWTGGVGFTREFPQEKFLRDSKIGAIYEGTSLIQQSTIAKLIQKEHGH